MHQMSVCPQCLARGIQSASQLVTCCAFGVIVQNSLPAPLFHLFQRLSPPVRMHPPLRCSAFSWMQVFGCLGDTRCLFPADKS